MMPGVETQPNPNLVKELIDRKIDNAHGVFDLRAVMEDLANQGREPLDEFRALLQESGVPSGHHFYAVKGLRSLALTRGLSPDDGRFLLAQTKRLAESPMALFDDAGYYDSLGVLSAWSSSAPALIEWAKERLREKDIHDWRWLAGFAAGHFWNEGRRQLTPEFIDMFQLEISGEEDPHRREQMEEMAANFRTSLQPNPTA